MENEQLHIPDEQLLLLADGELGDRRAAQVRAHLAACQDCRTRMAAIENTMTGVVRAHHKIWDAQVPSAAGPRALLKARLAQLTREPAARPWPFPFSAMHLAAVACVAFVAIALFSSWHFKNPALRSGKSPGIVAEARAIPDRILTPGSVRQVAVADVCSMPREEVVRPVPASLRQEVLKEYGIGQAQANDYEIDYLIAPGLGGTDDLYNLWPEPSTSGAWNARVKDALEERLHELVCTGKLDLTTARSDIATDWIAAYKKYFNTNEPRLLSYSMPAWPPHSSGQFDSTVYAR